MEEFSKELKVGAYKRLPEEQKEFIASEETTEIFRQIGVKYGLQLDMTGKMSDIVFLGLVGLVASSEVQTRLRREIPLSSDKMNSLINDLNEKIFLPFRNISLAGEGDVGRIPAEMKPDKNGNENAQPSKDDILAEIENPTPVAHPITVETGGPAVPREVLPEAKDAVAKDFIAGKLTETVNIPVQKTNVPEPTLKNPTPGEEKPKNYSVDPYREPLA